MKPFHIVLATIGGAILLVFAGLVFVECTQDATANTVVSWSVEWDAAPEIQ